MVDVDTKLRVDELETRGVKSLAFSGVAARGNEVVADVGAALAQIMLDVAIGDETGDFQAVLWEKARLGQVREWIGVLERQLQGARLWLIEQCHGWWVSKTVVDTLREMTDRVAQLQDVLQTLLARATSLLLLAIGMDVKPTTPGNGYRSLITITGRACRNVSGRLSSLSLHSTIIFVGMADLNAYLWDYLEIMKMLAELLQMALQIAHVGGTETLFCMGWLEETRQRAMKMPLQHFYGNRFGFQYSKGLQAIFGAILTGAATYSMGFDRSDGGLMRTLESLSSMAHLHNNPNERAEILMQRHNSSDVTFTKSFWNLPETTFVKHAAKILAPFVDINRVLLLPVEAVSVRCAAGHTNVEYPTGTTSTAISVRLLSYRWLRGQVYMDDHFDNYRAFVEANESAFKAPPTSAMVLHCHGGGFVAQSSLSHEVYLRQWAKGLGVPILSVDYSLAPDSPYPTAVNEVFYVYCWLLANSHLVGCLGDRIVLAGDSAGANICVAVALKAAMEGVVQPAGILACYPVLNVAEDISPSRLLSVMDPLLPMGILLTCLEAYAPVAQREESDVLLSPLLADESLLRQLCPVYLAACELDPLLDDSVMLGRRLNDLGCDYRLRVFEGLPHGFLCLVGQNEEAREATLLLQGWLADLLGVE